MSTFRASWWFGSGASLPPGPLWLWASPWSGALWPWSVGLLVLRARLAPWLWSVRVARIQRRAVRRAWWRARPRLARAWRRVRGPLVWLAGRLVVAGLAVLVLVALRALAVGV